MMSEDSDSDIKSPQGWAIIGAFLGVLFGYISTMENTLLVATSVIIGAGAVGAIVMNEIEYQFISSTGIAGTNFSSLGGYTSKNSIITLANPSGKRSMFYAILDRLITENTSDSLESVKESKYAQTPHFVPINVDNDELFKFISKHRDQLSIYPSYFIIKEDHGGGLIILHSVLSTGDDSGNLSKIIWYFSHIDHGVSSGDKYPFLLDDSLNFSSDWPDLDESEEGPNSIEELMDWGDEDQSGS